MISDGTSLYGGWCKVQLKLYIACMTSVPYIYSEISAKRESNIWHNLWGNTIASCSFSFRVGGD